MSPEARECRQTNNDVFQDVGELLMKLLVSAVVMSVVLLVGCGKSEPTVNVSGQARLG